MGFLMMGLVSIGVCSLALEGLGLGLKTKAL